MASFEGTEDVISRHVPWSRSSIEAAVPLNEGLSRVTMWPIDELEEQIMLSLRTLRAVLLCFVVPFATLAAEAEKI